MADKNNKGFAVFVLVCAVIVGVVILLTQSYADVHYYEYGFVKSKTTGSVDTSKVYRSGRSWIGPDKTFKTFDAYMQDVNLSHTTVFAAPDALVNNEEEGQSTGASLTISISVQIIYFLVPEDLKLLHDEYDVKFQDLMKSSARSALKDTASTFTLKQFYRDREMVENALLLGVQQRLGGMCCPVSCSVSNCFPGCIPRTQCKDTDKGLFVDARYLQLTDIKIPYLVEGRNLKTLRLTEETAKETFTQRAAIIEKETQQLVEAIQNSALEVTANSTAQAALIKANAQATYRTTIEDARRRGLLRLFDEVGLSTVEYKNSFDYLRSLADNDKAHLTVDFDQLIMGPTKLP